MNHTSGPWTFCDDSNDGKTNRIEIVARIYHSVPAEDLPNTRLISAASDLLVALQSILNMSLMSNDRWARTIELEARESIAKATGEKA